MFNRKITIIGAGSVGSATAYSLAVTGTASEVVLLDINEEKSLGEALDIFHGTPLMDNPVNVCSGDYEAARGSDVVVITSGFPRKPDETRLQLTQANVDVLRGIAPKITAICPDATYVLVSNPVDVLTYAFIKLTGLPETRVLGTGTLLDTARLRSYISRSFSVSQQSVHAYVFGEHGDSSFIPWSISNIAGVDPVKDPSRIHYIGSHALPSINCDEIERHIRTSGAEIIRRKGCTNYAIATAVNTVCEALFNVNSKIMTVSSMLNGEYDLKDVCLSIPTLVGNGKVNGHIMPDLSEEEYGKLRYSERAIREVLDQISF